MSLPERMREWVDWDVAAYILATEIGAIPPETSFAKAKWIFWNDSPVSTGMHAALLALVAAGVLETEDDELFRWASDAVSLATAHATTQADES